MASDFERYSKKFAVVLQQLGFHKGDYIHTVVANNNLLFPVFGGAWILGGICSTGADTIGPTSIHEQVRELSNDLNSIHHVSQCCIYSWSN